MATRQDKNLHDACGKGRLRKVRQILEEGGDVVSMLESRLGFLGYTPLHEAACQGHHDILRLLLIYGGDVDAKANGNYTPLHIAASMDYVKCIEVLLKNNANIKALDDFHKTPYQTAKQQKRKESAKTLKSAEIIQAAKDSPQELRSLLHDTSSKEITSTCFDEALIEACHAGNFDAVCLLLVAGASNIKDCIGLAVEKGHYRVAVLLFLCHAVYGENIPVLEALLDESLDCYEYLKEFIDKSLPMETVVGKLRSSLKNCTEDYTTVAIQLPGKSNRPVSVVKVLLLSTSCSRELKKVNWSGLSLGRVHKSWLDPIKAWVQNFNLSNNKLTSLPEMFIDLKKIVQLNLSGNKLKAISPSIFSLLCLRELNLSGNAITELPEISEWRPVLKILNLSDNNLSTLPQSISWSCIKTLNLSKNSFLKVPLCVCDITVLKDLDLSDNRDISYLPDEMGKLRNLTQLNLTNLDQITDPPEKMRRNAEDLVATLRVKLRSCEPYYTMKLMLVGKGGQGKTTLVHRLRDDYQYNENDLTQGVEISDLSIRRGTFYKQFNFKVWDFGGQEDYYATHQCFLSTMSLYLLVWRLTDGEEGVSGLVPWLDNIAVRSPGSTVIVVGTHLDCIRPEKHGHQHVTHLKNMVYDLVHKPRYRDKVLVPPQGICAVSCVSGDTKRQAEIADLRHIIYDTAANLKKGRVQVMGEYIPSSFISLIDRVEKRKTKMLEKRQPPIIRKEEFHAMVKENSQLTKKDIQDPMDVRDATVFLRERGLIMHFDDPNEGLNDLYFIDPRWLCALMARVVTVKSHADMVKEGVLEIQRTKVLFKGDDLHFDLYAQYIRLLVRFQIAYVLDESRLLVPSKLPEKKPKEVEELSLPFAPVRRAYKIDHQRIHGFWTRFMSRFFFYMKEMIAVDATRYQKSEDDERGFSAKFCRSCVHVEFSTRTSPCFVVDSEWVVDETPKKAPKPSATSARKQSPNPQRANSRAMKTNSPAVVAQSKKDPQDDELQALFLDPNVKLYTEEELAAADEDEVDSIVVNNVSTAMRYSFYPDSFGNKKKESFKRLAMDLRIPSFDESRSRREKKPRAAPSRSSEESVVDGAVFPGDEGELARNEQKHPATGRADSGGAERISPTFDDEVRREAPSEEARQGNDGEDKPDGVVASSGIHKMSTTSSPLFESEQTDGYGSGSEHAEQSKPDGVISGSNSECSSSFRSTEDCMESETVSESVCTNSGYVDNRMAASVSTTESVSSEDRTNGDGDSLVQSFSSLSHSTDGCVVTSMATRSQCEEASCLESESNNADEQNGKEDIGVVVTDAGPDPTQSGSRIPDEEDGANAEVTDSRTESANGVFDNGAKRGDVTYAKDDVIDAQHDFTESEHDITSLSDIVFNPIDDVVDFADGVTRDTEGDVTVNKSDVNVAKSDVTLAKSDVTVAKSYVTGVDLGASDATSQRADAVHDDAESACSTSLSGVFETSDTYPRSSSSSFASGHSIQSDATDQRDSANIQDQIFDASSNCCPSGTFEPERDGVKTPPQAADVETEKCTLCKENAPLDEMVTISLDVAELIERKFLHCWRSGVCMNHPNIFLAVCHHSLADTVVVESAVSPSPLGRRLLTFVVDHLDTLIDEWYPGLSVSYGATPTVQKLIPCRVCEKHGVPRPHRFTFDSCVTQYSMGNFVKCPRHEVSIQDVAPDVVLQDIDSDLLLQENEIEYERTDANKIGDGAFGKVYRGRCRGKDAAVKEYSTASADENALKRYCEIRKELNVLRRVGKHPFLVNLIGVCLRPFRLVLELAMEGSLANTLFNPDFKIERVVLHRMIYQVADALSFLHSLNVIYRDLKPENVLVLSYQEKADVNIKLTDFGTATFQFSEGLLALWGTPGYHAPEMLEEFSKRTGYDVKVDVFSLAMLIYGFITRRRPFYNIDSSAEINHLISEGKKPEYDDVMTARIGLAPLTWLMEKCMYREPYMRASAEVVAAQLRSPPFQLCLGLIALPCTQSVRHVCVVEATRELWVGVDDKASNLVLVYELNKIRLKKKFTINRISLEDPPLCMQINCMHVTATSVLIGLRGDYDVVTLHDLVTYELTGRIVLQEPVFCLSSSDQFIFLGMSSGVFRVVPNSSNAQGRTIEVSHSEPITCMVAIDKFLWLTIAKSIQIFHTEGGENLQPFELNAVRFSSSTSPLSHAVLTMDKSAVWCVSKGDSIVTCWDVNERQKICEINCPSVLSRLLSDGKPLDPVNMIVTCVVPALDTVWVGTGGGMLLILDACTGELITWMQLFDDHVRTLTLVSGPGPCSTEKCYVIASGKNVLETALSRGGKVVCRLAQDVIKVAPTIQPPTKALNRTRSKSRSSPFSRAKSPMSESQKSDVEDGVNLQTTGGLLLFFEALPADGLRRIEARS